MTSPPLRSPSTEALTGQETTSQQQQQTRGIFTRASPLQNLTCWFSELSQKDRMLRRRSSKRAASAVSEAPPAAAVGAVATVNETLQDTTLATTVTEEASNEGASTGNSSISSEVVEVLEQPLTPGKGPSSPTRLDTLSSRSQELRLAAKDKGKSAAPPAAAMPTTDGVSTLALAALHNAISGAPFADIELVVGAGDNNTLVHSAVLGKAAPDVLKEIHRVETLVLDSMEYSSAAPRKSIRSSITLPPLRTRSHSHAVFPSSGTDGNSDSSPSPARRFSKVVAAGVRRARTLSIIDPASRPVVPTPAPEPEPVTPIIANEDEDDNGLAKVQVQGLTPESLRALVFYLYTSQLHFVTSYASSTPTIDEDLRESSETNEPCAPDVVPGFGKLGATPPPFDALAAYALGETLKMDVVATKALAFIITHLQPNTALPLLLSPQAERFPQLRLSILEYVAANWDSVKAASGTQAVLKKLARGEYPYCSTALLSLLLDLDSHKAESK